MLEIDHRGGRRAIAPSRSPAIAIFAGVCESEHMRRVALIGAVLALSGCGGSPAAGAAAGCRGLPTAKRSVGLLVLFGAVNRFDRRGLCGVLGRPQAITHDAHGLVVWHYGSATLTFQADRIVSAGRPGEQLSTSQQMAG